MSILTHYKEALTHERKTSLSVLLILSTEKTKPELERLVGALLNSHIQSYSNAVTGPTGYVIVGVLLLTQLALLGRGMPRDA